MNLLKKHKQEMLTLEGNGYMTNFAAEMKRLAVISVSVMLTGIIIALGAGVSFVRCHHTQIVEIAQLTGAGGHADLDCCDDEDDCCGEATEVTPTDCMRTVTVRLEPTVTAQQQTVTLQTVYTPLTSFADMAGSVVLPTTVVTRARHADDAPHSPPRGYLRRLRVLLI